MLTVMLYRNDRVPMELFRVGDGDHISACPAPNGALMVQIRLRSMVDVYVRLTPKDYVSLVKAFAQSAHAPVTIELRETPD